MSVLNTNLPYLLLAIGSLLLFVGAYVIARVATRAARPRPAAASPDLGTEPPALVNLLTNRWRLNEDAGESTLLDLAARGYLEFRQPGNDPTHTTIHLPARPPDEPLLPYERRVLERVRGLAVDGVLPVTALTFRNTQRAKQWHRRFTHEVIKDARARGLSRRRFGSTVTTALMTVAVISSLGLTVASTRFFTGEDDSVFSGLYVGAFALVMLGGIASKSVGERDTPAGRAAAVRWLGLREWLRAHEQFADLPPAAVTVWDRYLPYGAAVGVTHTTSAVLDLGMGDRKRVWSSYGGQWRRVRVRYPRGLLRYGRSAPRLLLRGGLTLAVGAILTCGFGLPGQLPGGGSPHTSTLPPPPAAAADPVIDRGWDVVSLVAPLTAMALALLGGYILLRTLIDLATTRTITGEVLWVQQWRTRSQGKNSPSIPWLHYLAIDDGQADRTVAWGLPSELAEQVHDRDVATIVVRPWSRRITSMTVVTHGSTRSLVDAPVEPPDPATPTGFAALTGLGARDRSGPPPMAELLTAEEVSRAVGMLVRGPIRLPGPASVTPAAFHTVDRDRPVLMLYVHSGRLANLAWRRAATRGTPVPELGNGAMIDGDQAIARVGESSLLLMLTKDGRPAAPHLPWLLAQAVARLAAQQRPRAGDAAPAP